MCVIDNNRKWLSFVDALHTPGHTSNACQPTRYVSRFHAQAIGRCNRGQAITGVETTYQLCFDIDFSARQDGAETCAIRIKLRVHCSYCRCLVEAIVKNRNVAVRLQYLIRYIISIKNGNCLDSQALVAYRIEHFKESRFCAAIVLDSSMKVQMLVCNVGDDANIKSAAAYTLQFKPVRSRFNHCISRINVDHAP